VRLAPWQPEKFQPSHATAFDVGGAARLIGYDLDKTTARAGETLRLTLYWQVAARLDKDYTVFVHLLDVENRVVGQRDSQPLNGDYPTSFWRAGEIVQDVYEVPIDAQAKPGRHTLEVGMYLLATGERLPVLDAQGQPVADRRILLQPQIEIR